MLGSGLNLQRVYNKNVFYINNNLLALYSGLLKSIADFYEETFYTYTLATYEAFLQRLEEEYSQYNSTDNDSVFKPILPAISIDPLGEYTIPDHGAQLWRLPFLEGGPSFAAKYFMNTTNIKTEHFRMIIVPVKYSMNVEATIIADSMTKMIDLYNQTILMFNGGFNRPIRLAFIESDLILPDELMNDSYYNDATGEVINIYDEMGGIPFNEDGNQVIGKKIIKQLAGNEYYYIPWFLDPILRLQSITQQHDKYSSEAIHRWGFSFSFTCEVNVPAFIILDCDYKLDRINFMMDAPGSSINRNPTVNPNESIIVDEDETIKDKIERSTIIPAEAPIVTQYIPSTLIMNIDESRKCAMSFVDIQKTVRYTVPRNVVSDDPIILNFDTDFNIGNFNYLVITSKNLNRRLEEDKDYYIKMDTRELYLISEEIVENDLLYFVFY